MALVGPDLVIPGPSPRIPAAQQVLDRHLRPGTGRPRPGHRQPVCRGRRGKVGVKVKPVHTFDLVVLAAEWGYGRRTGWLSNLHLGARDPQGAFGEPGGFVMIGKTFKGLTDQTLRWQTETFPGMPCARPRCRVAATGDRRRDRDRRGPAVPRYPGGVALRFARVRAIATTSQRPRRTPSRRSARPALSRSGEPVR